MSPRSSRLGVIIYLSDQRVNNKFHLFTDKKNPAHWRGFRVLDLLQLVIKATTQTLGVDEGENIEGGLLVAVEGEDADVVESDGVHGVSPSVWLMSPF